MEKRKREKERVKEGRGERGIREEERKRGG